MLSVLLGRKVVLIDKWDVSEALRLVEKEKLTNFMGVPTMTYEMLHAPDRDKYDLSSLTDIGGGGAARPGVPGHQGGAARRAYTTGSVEVCELHAFVGQSAQMGGAM